MVYLEAADGICPCCNVSVLAVCILSALCGAMKYEL